MCECFIRVDCFLHCTRHQCHFRFVLLVVVCDLRRIGLHASSVDVLGAVEERAFEAVGGKVHGDKLPLRTAVVAAGQGSGYDEGGTDIRKRPSDANTIDDKPPVAITAHLSDHLANHRL